MERESSKKCSDSKNMTPIGFPLKGNPPSKSLTTIENIKYKKLNISSQKFPCFMPKSNHREEKSKTGDKVCNYLCPE